MVAFAFKMADFVAKGCMLITLPSFLISLSIVSFLRIGVSSAMLTLKGSKCCTRICPQKLNTFSLITFWNPLMNARDKIIAATLIVVAAIANRMMNREKDCSRLSAIRLAMNKGVFNQLI